MVTETRMPAPLDALRQRRHKWRNRLHTWLLAGGSVLLLAAVAHVFGGPVGVVWALLLGGVSLYLSTRVSPNLVLKLYKARPLQEHDFPEGYSVMHTLTARADLPSVPTLYYVPSRLMNAFAVGKPDDAAIAITDGILRGLTLRQLAGVLAHEVSHVRNGDIRVMALADMVNRMTSFMSTFGVIMLVLNIPAVLVGGAQIPWAGVLLLLAAPTIGALLQLALSRAREYDADLDAASMTGDPEGLASALVTLEQRQGRMWEMLLPGGRIPQPSILRTHPRTEDRVARLLTLRQDAPRHIEVAEIAPTRPRTSVPAIPGPRFHMRGLGVWY